MKRNLIAAAMLGSLLFAAASCSDDSKDSSGTAAPASTTADTATGGSTAGGSAAECAQGKTLKEGELTIATGEPAFPPYVIDDDPTTGKGFESALALAVAKEMGFTGDQVQWVRTSFDTAVAGSETNNDFNLQQFSISDDKKQTVDFSDPYYTSNQAVLGYADGPAKDVTKLSDLKKLKIGVAAATTSLQFVEDVIKPDAEAFVFNSNADAKTALDNGQIDVIVSDLPTAIYISTVEIEGTKVFGQFPVDAGGAGDQWGLLFSKGNPLVECANIALATLKDSGELQQITDQWMGQYTEAPMLSAD
jgi:polar amino acid transport system substrate-binding protein